MTTPLTKLIAENKWRPIAGLYTAGFNGDILISNGATQTLMEWHDGEEDFNAAQQWPTHFRPLPDDRLARAFEVFLEEADEVMAGLTDCDYSYAMNSLRNAWNRAEAIAEGKE